MLYRRFCENGNCCPCCPIFRKNRWRAMGISAKVFESHKPMKKWFGVKRTQFLSGRTRAVENLLCAQQKTGDDWQDFWYLRVLAFTYTSGLIHSTTHFGLPLGKVRLPVLILNHQEGGFFAFSKKHHEEFFTLSSRTLSALGKKLDE